MSAGECEDRFEDAKVLREARSEEETVETCEAQVKIWARFSGDGGEGQGDEKEGLVRHFPSYGTSERDTDELAKEITPLGASDEGVTDIRSLQGS